MLLTSHVCRLTIFNLSKNTMTHFEPPIHWADHEDIAMKLYERFGDEFNEGRIYRIRFTDLLEWILPTLSADRARKDPPPDGSQRRSLRRQLRDEGAA